jgi:rhodanese-related sulfurtransferase
MAATIDELLAAAEARISRYAAASIPQEAVIVDIRSTDSRTRAGVIPGALHIPRSVLEWRVAPTSKWRTPYLNGAEQLVLLCDQGYSSILAAAMLLDLGVNAGDVIGGFEAWLRAELPVKPAGQTPPGLPGTGPPD